MNLKKLKIVFSLITVSILVLSVFSGISNFSHITDANASSISDLAKQQDNIQKQLASIKAEKVQLNEKSKDLQGELSWLNSKSKEQRREYEKLMDELEQAYKEVEQAINEARQADENVKAKQEEFTVRLQKMFENRNRSSLEMLFSAKDLTSFLANAQIITIIAESDRKVIEELSAAKDESFIKQEVAIQHSKDLENFVEEKNAQIQALKANIDKTQSQINNVKGEISNAERQEKELLAQSNKIADEIKRLQTLRNYYGGDMVWPTPGNTRITSPFGSRFLFGYWSMHNGVDIGAPFGAKMVAVADGKVIVRVTIPGYNSRTGNNYGSGGGGYGNYLIIDHGGGISTVYAHAKLLRVSEGDEVKAGQWIADVGSTGISTGPHLHFEVRENGSPVNPLQKKYLGVR